MPRQKTNRIKNISNIQKARNAILEKINSENLQENRKSIHSQHPKPEIVDKVMFLTMDFL